jgi:hypothetical protein
MRMSKSPDAVVVKVNGDWALAEWYPRRAQRANPSDSAKVEGGEQDDTGPAQLEEHKFESNL